MTTAHRLLATAATLLLMTACQVDGDTHGLYGARSSAPLDASIRTDRQEYPAGSAITVRLVNTTARSVGYNLCTSQLERNDEEVGWTRVRQAEEACTQELRTLRPRQSTVFTFKIAPHIKPGEYRVASDVRDLQAGTAVTLVSAPFKVVAYE
jgi:hypothetical protein